MAPIAAGRACSAVGAGFARARADGYAALAALLGPPTSEFCLLLRSLAWEEGLPQGLARALEGLARAAGEHTFAGVAAQYERLFVGLGSGELVPYASWYRAKTLQSRPLALLRSDLRRLGIVRRDGAHETEDHAGALCEIMALLAHPGGGVPLPVQARFFDEHVACWMPEFFRDLRATRGAGFYRAVGVFGGEYLDVESAFLGSPAGRGPRSEGG
jgi:TorA maturation chaperone TorD